MTAVLIVGFVIGAGAMLARAGFGMGKRHPSHGIGFVIAYWAFIVFSCLFSGAMTAVFFSLIAAPVIAFADRVEAIERRCPPDASRSQ